MFCNKKTNISLPTDRTAVKDQGITYSTVNEKSDIQKDAAHNDDHLQDSLASTITEDYGSTEQSIN